MGGGGTAKCVSLRRSTLRCECVSAGVVAAVGFAIARHGRVYFSFFSRECLQHRDGVLLVEAASIFTAANRSTLQPPFLPFDLAATRRCIIERSGRAQSLRVRRLRNGG